jgi:hypothetical protein
MRAKQASWCCCRQLPSPACQLARVKRCRLGAVVVASVCTSSISLLTCVINCKISAFKNGKICIMKWQCNCPFLTKATKFGDKRNKHLNRTLSWSHHKVAEYFELSLDDSAPKSTRHGSIPPGTLPNARLWY